MSKFIISDQNALSVGGHYLSYTLGIAEESRRKNFDVHVLCHKKLVIKNKFGISFHGIYSKVSGQEGVAGHIEDDGIIVHETEVGLRLLCAGPQDHLLLHTLDLKELYWWLKYLAGLPIYRLNRLPKIHLLMRFDPSLLLIADDPSWRPVLSQIVQRKSVLTGYVNFCSDTNLLARQYSNFLSIPVHVVPIPVSQALELELKKASRQKRSDTKTILYLGDARIEKGFLQLPLIVRHLWESKLLSRKLRFVIQANTNIPGGEPGVSDSVKALSEYPPSKVRLISSSMAPSVYFRTLARSDVVLVAYDQDAYKWRSSGVLVEALAAGKPVVTTPGTWMAAQVNPAAAMLTDSSNLAKSLIKLIDRLPEAAKQAKADSKKWQRSSSPCAFVKELLKLTPKNRYRALSKDSPYVIYVARGDEILKGCPTSQIAYSHLSYLFSRNYRVSAIFIFPPDPRGPQDLEASLSMDQVLQDFPFEKVMYISSDRGFSFQLPVDASAEMNAGVVDTLFVNHHELIDAFGETDFSNVSVICEFHKSDLVSGTPLRGGSFSKIDCAIVQTSSTAEWLSAKFGIQCLEASIPFSLAGGKSLYGYRNLAEIVGACRPRDPDLQWHMLAPRKASYTQERLIQFAGRLDLLCVLDNTPDNVRWLQEFLYECFVPSLTPTGITLAVVGEIKYARDWSEQPAVAFTGALTDPALMYAAAKVVIVPRNKSTASRMVRLLAAKHRRPVVEFCVPLVHEGGEGADRCDIPKSVRHVASVVKNLVGNEKRRRVLALRQVNNWKRLGSQKAYYETLDRAFSNHTRPKVQHYLSSDTYSSRSQKSSHLVWKAWSKSLHVVSQVVAHWLGAEPILVGRPNRASREKWRLPEKEVTVCLASGLKEAFLTTVSRGDKEFVHKDLRAAGKTATAVSGLNALRTRGGANSFRAQLILGSSSTNTLLVRYVCVAETISPTIPSLRVEKVRVAPSAVDTDGFENFVQYRLPALPRFSRLQLMDITLFWSAAVRIQIRSIALVEAFPIDTIFGVGASRRQFYDIEHPLGFRPFAWTRTSQVRINFPVWAGIEKRLEILVHSFRASKAEREKFGILTNSGEVVTPLVLPAKVGDGGRIVCELNRVAELGSSLRTIELAIPRSSVASATDLRTIGISIEEFKFLTLISSS